MATVPPPTSAASGAACPRTAPGSAGARPPLPCVAAGWARSWFGCGAPHCVRTVTCRRQLMSGPMALRHRCREPRRRASSMPRCPTSRSRARPPWGPASTPVGGRRQDRVACARTEQALQRPTCPLGCHHTGAPALPAPHLQAFPPVRVPRLRRRPPRTRRRHARRRRHRRRRCRPRRPCPHPRARRARLCRSVRATRRGRGGTPTLAWTGTVSGKSERERERDAPPARAAAVVRRGPSTSQVSAIALVQHAIRGCGARRQCSIHPPIHSPTPLQTRGELGPSTPPTVPAGRAS